MLEANKIQVFNLVQDIGQMAFNNELTDQEVVDYVNRIVHGQALSVDDLSTLEDAACIMHNLFASLCAYNNN